MPGLVLSARESGKYGCERGCDFASAASSMSFSEQGWPSSIKADRPKVCSRRISWVRILS
jgi:hypothetical protein